MSAGSQHPVGPAGPDGIPDPEMSALPGADEPDWDEDDYPELSVPEWEIPDPGDPLWETPDPGDPLRETADPGDPVRETPDLHDPCDNDPPQGAPFADGGWADALAPGPVLATLVDLVQRDGLGKLDDDQLTGVLQAASRLAAWCAAQKLSAVSALAARRGAGRAGRRLAAVRACR